MIKRSILIIRHGNNDFENEINHAMECSADCKVLSEESLFDNENYKEENGRIAFYLACIKISFKIKKEKYKKIIVFDNLTLAVFLSTILCRKINLFYWNKESIPYLKLIIAKICCNIWTFDGQMAEKYGINHTRQFYFEKDKLRTGEERENCGLFFVGKDKGRAGKILEIVEYCKEQGINYFFYVRHYGNQKINNEYFKSHADFMNYRDVISTAIKCDAIVELVINGQEGLTLRTMEALFFDKRMITNNVSVKNEVFYDPDKIYVFNEKRDLKDLKEWLNKKVSIDYSSERDIFLFSRWLENFY